MTADRAEYLAGYLAGTGAVPIRVYYANHEPHYARGLQAGFCAAWCGVDLSACDYRRVVDDADATEASAEFDVFVNGTYLSKAINHAPVGYYYVHFPGEVPTRADHVRSRVGIAGVKAF
jgi:hypothetical protein